MRYAYYWKCSVLVGQNILLLEYAKGTLFKINVISANFYRNSLILENSKWITKNCSIKSLCSMNINLALLATSLILMQL